MPDTQALLAGVLIAGVAALPLGLVFGFTRRALIGALGCTIAVAAFYPGGTTGLVVDALRPVHAFVQGAKDRAAARDAAIGEAADGQAAKGTR